MTVHYIDKERLHADLVEWATARDAALASSSPPPPVPRSIGAALIAICENTATRSNFNGYTYVEEMVGDAIVDCTRAVNNYKIDHAKKNPFGYFSQIAWRAMLRRIELEGTQTKVKQDLFFDENYAGFTTMEGDDAHIDKNEMRNFYTFGE